MDVLSADLREGRSEPCVYLGEEEEWGRGAASAETTRQRVYRFLKRQVRWSGIHVSFRIVHSLL